MQMENKIDLKVTKKENKEEGKGGQEEREREKKKIMSQNKALSTPKRTLYLARGKAGLRHRE